VVVGNPGSLQTLRYPMLLVAPLTTTGLDSGLVYPVLSGGAGGLRNSSTVLLDQVSSVDVRRVKGFVGQLSRAEYQPIRDGLEALLLV
jgi:mRNA-degrading endonuclease toxin of MazEF toxin-antitoxin module